MKRFWDKVKQGPGCWEWMKGALISGRGYFRFRGAPRLANRIAWILTRGEIPEGMCVLHRCDNPKCVNPDHLFLGTQADNLADMRAKGRYRNPTSKLTASDVLNIRILDIPQINLAKLYGVTKTTISRIKLRRIWKHVA
jgi:HNH endonuclease